MRDSESEFSHFLFWRFSYKIQFSCCWCKANIFVVFFFSNIILENSNIFDAYEYSKLHDKITKFDLGSFSTKKCFNTNVNVTSVNKWNREKNVILCQRNIQFFFPERFPSNFWFYQQFREKKSWDESRTSSKIEFDVSSNFSLASIYFFYTILVNSSKWLKLFFTNLFSTLSKKKKTIENNPLLLLVQFKKNPFENGLRHCTSKLTSYCRLGKRNSPEKTDIRVEIRLLSFT